MLGVVSAAAQDPRSTQLDCSDPLLSNSAACRTSTTSDTDRDSTGTPQRSDRTSTSPTPQERTPEVYVDSAGRTTQSRNAELNERPRYTKPDPPTDMQRLAQESTGDLLPIFGSDLFREAPSTFAPSNEIAVVPDYLIGPGDEIIVRIWGHDGSNSRLTVDRSGAIYIPHVGSIHVAGQRFGDLHDQLTREVSHTFRNFDLSVNLGQLRSIQVFVVGEARHPGTYTLSSLSTVLNAVFASGGPTVRGSLRDIQIRRGGVTISHFDLYDLALRGDKSRDVPLQSGDVIFIPAVGPQVAIAGSVRHPAVYELNSQSTVAELLQMSGGLSSTASNLKISLERIEEHHLRRALSVALDPTGEAMQLRDGDILHVDSILRGYEQSVTIRGNLANPGRFPWHPGMRLSDIIPDRLSLLTNGYWRERNRLGVPTPLFEPYDMRKDRDRSPTDQLPNRTRRSTTDLPPNATRSDSTYDRDRTDTDVMPDQGSDADMEAVDRYFRPGAMDSRIVSENGSRQGGRDILPTASESLNRSSLAEQQEASTSLSTTANDNRRVDIKIPAPEIDWSYAVIERLDPKTLKSSLVPFNLGKLVDAHDDSQNLTLNPGDVVTILSQADIHVGQDEQTKFVRLEGEFVSSGVYSVGPNETLVDVVQRAGGFTSKAYLFGASFTRESARILQQQRLDEYVSTLSVELERQAASRAASATSPAALTSGTEEDKLIARLRQMRATGRVVLEFKPDSQGLADVQRIPMEDGDTFRVPSKPLIISVVGAVYGQNVFLYNADRRVRDYLALAGKPNRVADKSHAFIIRADGSILSKQAAKKSFDSLPISPGDTIVIPEKPIKPSALRDVLDYSQVFSQFAIGAAAVNVIR